MASADKLAEARYISICISIRDMDKQTLTTATDRLKNDQVMGLLPSERLPLRLARCLAEPGYERLPLRTETD